MTHFFRYFYYHVTMLTNISEKVYFILVNTLKKNIQLFLYSSKQCSHFFVSFLFFVFLETFFFFGCGRLLFKSLVFIAFRKQSIITYSLGSLLLRIHYNLLHSFSVLFWYLWYVPVNVQLQYMGWSDQMKYVKYKNYLLLVLIRENKTLLATYLQKLILAKYSIGTHSQKSILTKYFYNADLWK